MRRATLCFSMYSDMSIRTMASSVLKRNEASAFASSVLPTPDGWERGEGKGKGEGDDGESLRASEGRACTGGARYLNTRRGSGNRGCVDERTSQVG